MKAQKQGQKTTKKKSLTGRKIRPEKSVPQRSDKKGKVKNMKKKTLAFVLAITVVMGAALTGCGNSGSEERTGTGKESTVTVEEKSEEEKEETKETSTDEISENKEPEDYTYCNLLSDPYFDWDNAIKDEEGTTAIQDGTVLSTDKEILYNIVDGDRYVELSGAESYDVNRTITMHNGIGLFQNLAYYGVEPNPNLSMVPETRFSCMDTTYFDRDTTNETLWDKEYEVTVTKAYTVPTDSESGHYYCYVGAIYEGGETPALCEVEYNGTHYWTTNISLEKALGELE